MKKTKIKVSFVKAALCAFALLHGLTAWTQTTTNISGIINTYHRVVEIIPSKACIRVSSTAGLNVNTPILLLQMKGASISTTNNSTFGDTTSLNNAGDYEVGTICGIFADSVFLFHQLLNTYDVANGKVQLVQFGAYHSANVIDTIKAQPWDSTAGTGGVIALFATQDITLNAPVYADSGGYRGGAYVLSNGTCSNIPAASNYVYNAASAAPQNGAYKGESVANLPAANNGGRGAPANGGGGGNNHNNSGGGGANLSAGGIGGGNSSSTGCSTTIRGEAGKALKNWSGKKIFFGGGGGAGHSNNGIFTKGGGNGGGLVFIWADRLIGNGQTISANGGTGGQSQSDGAGGGGAGGTIIMHVTNYSGSATISANGGNGGNSDDGGNIKRCFGGGGGGSGGVICYTGSIPPVTNSVTGGAAGAETSRDPACAAAQPAAAGSIGQIFSSYLFTASTIPASYCTAILPVNFIYFRAVTVNDQVALSWQVSNPERILSFRLQRSSNTGSWTEAGTVYANEGQQEYRFTDQHPATGHNFYRLLITEKNGSISYSPTRHVVLNNLQPDFSIMPNPAHDRISIAGVQLPGPQSLIIRDISGKMIFRKTIPQLPASVQLPALTPGIYVVEIGTRSQKLVVR